MLPICSLEIIYKNTPGGTVAPSLDVVLELLTYLSLKVSYDPILIITESSLIVILLKLIARSAIYI